MTAGTPARARWCQYCRKQGDDVRRVPVSTGWRHKCLHCRQASQRARENSGGNNGGGTRAGGAP